MSALPAIKPANEPRRLSKELQKEIEAAGNRAEAGRENPSKKVEKHIQATPRPDSKLRPKTDDS